MQKTKIGISAGCFGAVIYLAGVTGGLLLAAILIGYVLLVRQYRSGRKFYSLPWD